MIFAADLLYFIHVILILVVISPLFFPAGNWLKYHVIMICLILIDWHLPDGDGGCALTDLERKLRGLKPRRGRPQFMYRLLNTVFGQVGVRLTHNESDDASYLVMVTSLLVAFFRFCAFRHTPVRFQEKGAQAWALGIGFLLVIHLVNQAWPHPELPPTRAH